MTRAEWLAGGWVCFVNRDLIGGSREERSRDCRAAANTAKYHNHSLHQPLLRGWKMRSGVSRQTGRWGGVACRNIDLWLMLTFVAWGFCFSSRKCDWGRLLMQKKRGPHKHALWRCPVFKTTARSREFSSFIIAARSDSKTWKLSRSPGPHRQLNINPFTASHHYSRF